MVSLNLVLAAIMAPLLAAKTAHASFAYCIGINDYSALATGYAFTLKNDDGSTASDFFNLPFNHGLTLSDNGWKVKIGAFKNGHLQSLQITHNKYSFDSNVPFEKLCGYTDGRPKAIYGGCFDNGGSFCSTNYDSFKYSCTHGGVDMRSMPIYCP
ncbi:hypothetical protein BGZ80_011094 [Entomortierella chlamydospora]|uniref:Uncharacterized protein n=1 Tax=Entomortierella chlamydospora TaxID=101097 RepID=A0A9P6N2U0_9FUNG|nr:hypothetical protein BGZ79_011107 [Entomortierella chlamydospora]KAG0022813.1 hypothetical protein BGZ80_011094 [Entomortierella chlamydospora]